MQPIYQAACQGDLKKIRQLVELDKVDVNASGNLGWGDPPLFGAAQHGQVEALKLLLNLGADPSGKGTMGWGSWGQTPWEVALSNGHYSITVELIKHNVHQSLSPHQSNQAFIEAAGQNDLSSMKKILGDFEASINGKKSDTGETALHVAVANGELDTVNFLLDMGAKVNISDIKGNTPFQVASAFGRHHIIQALVDNGANIDAQNFNGQNALHQAVSNSNLNVVKGLIENYEVSINQQDAAGQTPLLLGCIEGNPLMVEYLIRAGGQVNEPNKFGETPLMLASLNGHEEAVALLLHAHANVHHVNDQGQSALQLAAYGGKVGSLRALLNKGAKLEQVDVQGQTALHFAAKSNSVEASQYLLNLGLSINHADHKGKTPIMVAAEYSQLEMVNSLLAHHAQLYLTDKDGNSVLHHAVNSGQFTIILNCLKHGALVDQKNAAFETPLMLACKQSDFNAVKLLVKDFGADLNVMDQWGQTPLFMCIKSNEPLIAEYLLSYGADPDATSYQSLTPLQLASQQGDLNLVQSLVKYGADLDVSENKHQESALIFAARKGHTAIVDFLIKSGANPDLTDHLGHSALYEAYEHDHWDCVETLVKGGGDSSVLNSNFSVLSQAARYGRVDLVRELLDFGMDPNIPDPQGQRPLTLAVENNFYTIAESLLMAGADPNIIDPLSGQTPLHAAVMERSAQMVDLLLSHDAYINISDSEYGLTPAQMAEHLHYHEIVNVIEEHWDPNLNPGSFYVEEPVMVYSPVQINLEPTSGYVSELHTIEPAVSTLVVEDIIDQPGQTITQTQTFVERPIYEEVPVVHMEEQLVGYEQVPVATETQVIYHDNYDYF